MISKLKKLEIEDGAMDPANATPNVEEFFAPKKVAKNLDKKNNATSSNFCER